MYVFLENSSYIAYYLLYFFESLNGLICCFITTPPLNRVWRTPDHSVVHALQLQSLKNARWHSCYGMRMRFALGENRHGLVGEKQAFQCKQSSRFDHKHVAAIVHSGKIRPPLSVCFSCPSGHTKARTKSFSICCKKYQTCSSCQAVPGEFLFFLPINCPNE